MIHYGVVRRLGLLSYVITTILILVMLAYFVLAAGFDSKLQKFHNLIYSKEAVWLRIARFSGELVKGENPDHVLQSIQKKLKEDVETELALGARIQDVAKSIRNDPFAIFYGDRLMAIGQKDIRQSVRSYVTSLAETPLQMLEARYTSVSSVDAVLLKSHHAMQPFTEAKMLLTVLQSDIFRTRKPMSLIVSGSLLLAVWGSWLGLLRPSLARADALQAEIIQAEQRARVTLHSIGDAVVTTDANGMIDMINPVAEKITGFLSSEVKGRHVDDFLMLSRSSDGVAVENPIGKVLQRGTVVGLANGTRVRTKQGGYRLITDAAAPIMYPDGSMQGAVLVFRDVTEDHQMRDELRHNDKIRAIGQLAGGMAHEFNNGLAVIAGAREVLAMELSNNKSDIKACEDYLEMIDKAVKQSSSLTDRLLSIGRKTDLSREAVDLIRPINEAVEVLRRTTDRSIDIVVNSVAGQDERIVNGDFASLQSVFLNMGLNSIHAIEGVGRVDISVEVEALTFRRRQILRLRSDKENYVKITWTDTGQGIDPDRQDKIFEAFFTSKADDGGSGLGLSVVQSTVTAHHGVINVESEPGVGTTFVLYLPQSRQLAATPLPVMATPVGTSGGLILVVDDEAGFLKLVQDFLSAAGFKTLTAPDGEQAIKLLEKHHRQVQVIVLDMNMPKLSGSQAAKRMREIDPDCKIIFSTGYVASDVGITDKNTRYFNKPYDFTALLHAIDQFSES